MNELVKIDQDVTIVPRDFNFTNMGSVTEVTPQGFRMKMKYPTSGIKQNYICEFYSHTQNGILFFSSHASEVKDNELFIANPIKHRFLQRRQFTRIKFLTETTMRDLTTDKVYDISTVDLSAGGLKFFTNESINLDDEYKVEIVLSEEQNVSCILQPIRMEKKDNGRFILSGRFVHQVNVDKMTLIQYCMNKNMEAENK